MSSEQQLSHRVELRRSITAKDRRAWLSKRIDLPFIPTIGMTIVGEAWSIEVHGVEWQYDEGFVYVTDKHERTNDLLEVERENDPSADEWEGWELAKPR